LCSVIGKIDVPKTATELSSEERSGMQSQSNEFRPRDAERLFLAVVNQAISDALEIP
jgi:hypothetical protein